MDVEDNQQETARHWLAGVFDAEGCVAVEKISNPKSTRYYVSVRIYNKDFSIINHARKVLENDGMTPYLFENNEGVAAVILKRREHLIKFFEIYTKLVQTKKDQCNLGRNLVFNNKCEKHFQELSERNKQKSGSSILFTRRASDEENLHWLAGFLEGDGCISMSKSAGKYRVYQYPRVTFHNVHNGTVQQIKDILDRFEISYSCSSTFAGKKQKFPVWQIGVGSMKSVKRLLELLDGKLVGEKKGRREAMLDMLSKKAGSSESKCEAPESSVMMYSNGAV